MNKIFTTSMKPKIAFATVAMMLAGTLAHAQTPRPTPRPRPSVINGNFERFSTQQNLWDGVDSSGYLSGNRISVNLVREDGSIGETPVPPSIAVVDFNNDGLLDIVLADPTGWTYVYFNKGSKTEPVFEQGELIPIFTALPLNAERATRLTSFTSRRAGRVAVAPLTNPQRSDLVFGNYLGELFIFPNTGTPGKPSFRFGKSLDDNLIPTTATGNLWSNLLAPAIYDFNNDRKIDLIVGEGAYSANSVHLLINSGSSASPKFVESDRHYLVYGDGREQLAPALVDYNGDGAMDILVGDRRGQVSVHLNPGKSWKPGEDFPLASMITFGKSDRLGSAVTVSTGDINGDGLFDIFLGRINGRVSVAKNIGTAQEPKFEAPVDIKGKDGPFPRFKIPSNWTIYDGVEKGNAYAFISVVDEKDDPNARPIEGKASLRAGYVASYNQVMDRPQFAIEGPDTRAEPTLLTRSAGNNFSRATAATAGARAGSKTFILRTSDQVKLIPGQEYEIIFYAKGNRVRNAKWSLAYGGYKKLSEPKLTQGARGSVQMTHNEASEIQTESGSFSPGTEWREVKSSFKVNLRDRNLRDLTEVSNSVLEITFDLPEPDSTLYIDDVRVVQK